jgi:hypothetical protein
MCYILTKKSILFIYLCDCDFDRQACINTSNKLEHKHRYDVQATVLCHHTSPNPLSPSISSIIMIIQLNVFATRYNELR